MAKQATKQVAKQVAKQAAPMIDDEVVKEAASYFCKEKAAIGARTKYFDALFSAGWRAKHLETVKNGGSEELRNFIKERTHALYGKEAKVLFAAPRGSLSPEQQERKNSITRDVNSRYRDTASSLLKRAIKNGEVKPKKKEPRAPRQPAGEGEQEASNKSAKTIVIESLLNAKKKLEQDNKEVKHYKRVIAAIDAALAAITDDSEL